MSAPKLIQRIDIFISSPSDVSPEREIAARVIERLNRLSYVRERYYLRLLAYEKSVPPAVGETPQTVVDEYMMQAKDADILVCMMWARMGTPVIAKDTGRRYESGTEYEFTTAYEANQRSGKPYILLYQKLALPPTPDPEQNTKVNEFFQKFEGEHAAFKGLYQRYTTVEQFEEMLFEHLEQVITRRLISNPQTLIDPSTRPQIQEETRRLDAAMPDETKANRETEVWVQVCVPSSEGFRAMLPAYTKSSREQITQRDVRAGNLAVAFPIDPATGQPSPIRVIVELRADDFRLDESQQETMLSPRADSGLLVFKLVPKSARERAIVHVIVRQRTQDGTVLTLGSTALSTRVHGPNAVIAVAQIAWNLLSIPLAAVELSPVRRKVVEDQRVVIDDPLQLDTDEDSDRKESKPQDAKADAIDYFSVEKDALPTTEVPAPPPPPAPIVPPEPRRMSETGGGGSRNEALKRLRESQDQPEQGPASKTSPGAGYGPPLQGPVAQPAKPTAPAGLPTTLAQSSRKSSGSRVLVYFIALVVILLILLGILILGSAQNQRSSTPGPSATPTDVIF